MAAHSSILAWEIPWTEEPGGLQSRGGHKKSDMTKHMSNATRRKPNGSNARLLKMLCSSYFPPPHGLRLLPSSPNSILAGLKWVDLFLI